MSWSWRVATIAGIGIYVHWTFILILGCAAYVYAREGGAGAIVEGLAFIIAVFACIVAHELGHALTARRFGIRTRDITLLPIGGLARLERMPDDPTQELLVAVGGPAVTLAIAALLLAVSVVLWPAEELLNLDLVEGRFLVRLGWVNAILLGFNLLPAFPMDGGRVLRAVLHYRMDYVDATRIASTVGQIMAICFGILGLFFNWFLLFIAIFVYLGAQQEARFAEVRSALSSVPVRSVMETGFRTLPAEATVSQAIDALLDGEQKDFPVMEDGRVIGLLTRARLVEALRQRGGECAIREVLLLECAPVDDDEMLDRVVERMQLNGCATLPVMRRGQLVGILTLENVGEWIMIQDARRAHRGSRTNSRSESPLR
jgi:Zn-dependent protease